jgi:uncharacterized membrane-anchored protein
MSFFFGAIAFTWAEYDENAIVLRLNRKQAFSLFWLAIALQPNLMTAECRFLPREHVSIGVPKGTGIL